MSGRIVPKKIHRTRVAAVSAPIIPLSHAPTSTLEIVVLVKTLVRHLEAQCVSKHPTKGDTVEQEVDFAGGNVELITNKEEWDNKLAEAGRDGRIVIANFSAVWCSPCENMVPFYCSLSVKFPYMMFLTVDVDELSDFSSSMDIKATPTFLILKDGELIHKLVGANKTELQKKIDSLATSSPNRALI